MFERIVEPIVKRPSRLALPAAILAVILNVAVLSLWFQRTRSANVLAAQIALIEENLARIGQVEEGELDQLRAELEAAEERLASLKTGVAGAEAGYDVVSEVLGAAEQSGLEILSVETEEVTNEDAAGVSLTITRVGFRAEGRFPAFVRFVQAFEAAAPESVTLDSIQVTSQDRSCSFEVIVLSGVEVESD